MNHKRRFWDLYYVATIISLCVLSTAKAQTFPDAEAFATFQTAHTNPPHDAAYVDFGRWNYFWVNIFECTLEGEPPDWVCYGRFVHTCTSTLKPGREPSITLLYNASSTSRLNPQFMYGRPFRGTAGIIYTWRLRSIHSLAPHDLILPVDIDYVLDVSVNLPNPDFIHKATAEVFIDELRDGLTVSNDDPGDKSCRFIHGYQSRVDVVHYIYMEADLYIDPYGMSTQSSCCRGSASIMIDPRITIDPDFMVNIDGGDYPANQLYEVEISANLSVPLKPLAMPWIPLLLLND